MGDFNARIHGMREHEEETIGPHIFGKGLKYLEKKQMDREVLNRDLLMEVARENDLRITNTWFKKPESKLISFRIPGTTDLKEIDNKKFATTDHILCKNNQTHLVLNVETNTKTAFPSDHYPMVCTVKNVVLPNKHRKKRINTFVEPNEGEKEAFNRNFKL